MTMADSSSRQHDGETWDDDGEYYDGEGEEYDEGYYENDGSDDGTLRPRSASDHSTAGAQWSLSASHGYGRERAGR